MLSAVPLAAIETNNGTFYAYVAALVISGILLLLVGATGFGGQSVGMRILDGVIALAMLGYAFYLFFLFEGGNFRMFIYAFFLPVFLIVAAFKNRKQSTTSA